MNRDSREIQSLITVNASKNCLIFQHCSFVKYSDTAILLKTCLTQFQVAGSELNVFFSVSLCIYAIIFLFTRATRIRYSCRNVYIPSSRDVTVSQKICQLIVYVDLQKSFSNTVK